MIEWITGDRLSVKAQNEAKALFVHRFTREHIPLWSCEYRSDGSNYAVQFASDADWLRHTKFAVHSDGTLSKRAQYCESSPTWPDNPELKR